MNANILDILLDTIFMTSEVIKGHIRKNTE